MQILNICLTVIALGGLVSGKRIFQLDETVDEDMLLREIFAEESEESAEDVPKNPEELMSSSSRPPHPTPSEKPTHGTPPRPSSSSRPPHPTPSHKPTHGTPPNPNSSPRPPHPTPSHKPTHGTPPRPSSSPKPLPASNKQSIDFDY